jgi:hypothetical protein
MIGSYSPVSLAETVVSPAYVFPLLWAATAGLFASRRPLLLSRPPDSCGSKSLRMDPPPNEMVSRMRAKLARLGARRYCEGHRPQGVNRRSSHGRAGRNHDRLRLSPRPRLRAYRGEAHASAARISSGSLPSQHASSQTGVQKRHDVP